MSSSDRTRGSRDQLGRQGFEHGSDGYERVRPGYPADAVTRLVETTGIGAGSRVLDLAAGTGKLTRQLRVPGAARLGIEPSVSMRQVFTRVLGDVPLAAGTAEMVPLRAASMDTVVIAQAFHWFDPVRALAEIARVLRPMGWLALIWNERDESDPVMAELVRISQWDRCQPYPTGKDFGPVIDRSVLFGPVQRTKFAFVQWLGRPAFVEQVSTRSYVRVLGEHERRALLDRVAEFGTTLDEPIAMPYITDLFCAQVAG